MNDDDKTLNDLVAEFERLKEEKKSLADLTDQNSEALKKIQERIMDKMVELDMPSATIYTEGYGTYTYSPSVSTIYSLNGEEKAQEEGYDRFQVLRDNGFGYLIYETVNQRSFGAAMREYMANADPETLPKDLMAVVSTYDDVKVSRKKAAGSASFDKLKSSRK